MRQGMMGVLAFCIVASASAFAAEGNGVGNGSDPLRRLFLEARLMAADKAAKVKTCSFGPEVPANVRDWILAHRADLVSDLRRTQQIWITDPQPTCAWTQPKDAADVTLSFEACRPLIKTHEDAMHQLFHESVHHFDITDEAFPEAVAFALDRAVTEVACQADPTDPFNPDACPGEPITPKEFLGFFGPGGDSVSVGTNYEPVVYRRRKCLGPTEDTCTEWQYHKLLVSSQYSGSEELGYRARFSIAQGMRVDLMYSRTPLNVGLELLLEGVGTPEISAKGSRFPWADSSGGSLYHFKVDKLEAKGRMTRDCLVLRATRDLEHEAAFVIRYGQ